MTGFSSLSSSSKTRAMLQVNKRTDRWTQKHPEFRNLDPARRSPARLNLGPVNPGRFFAV